MPTAIDQARATHQEARLSVVLQDWDELAYDWLKVRIGEERLTSWGLPNTSANPLSDVAFQLSNPGLYATRPQVGTSNPEALALVGQGGQLDAAGYWTLMQYVQYLTYGIGDMFVAFDVASDALTVEPVYPHDIRLIWDPARPGVAVGLWRRRLRALPADAGGEQVWAWDQWDLGERRKVDGVTVETRPPSLRIVACSGTFADQPITNLVVPGAPEVIEGEAYRWRRQDGSPMIPFVRYQVSNSGGGWNHYHFRGALRGTYETMSAYTYTGRAAQDATGRAVIAAGLRPIVSGVVGANTAGAVRSVNLTPGAILYHEAEQGQQVVIQEVGPGANLETLSAYAHEVERRVYQRCGIDVAGAEKGASDPTSGAAKFVSRQEKRQNALRVKPLFEASDLEAIAISSALLRVYGVMDVPETGYSIDYGEIGLSIEEQAALRDDIDWQEERGQISKVKAYQLRHPGVSEADAGAALVAAAVADAKLAAAIEAALPEGQPTPGATDGGVAAVADTALNGAQAQALTALVQQVSGGQLAPDVARQLLPIMFPTIGPDRAEAIISAAAAFTPQVEDPDRAAEDEER
jgi:hypothetical protein